MLRYCLLRRWFMPWRRSKDADSMRAARAAGVRDEHVCLPFFAAMSRRHESARTPPSSVDERCCSSMMRLYVDTSYTSMLRYLIAGVRRLSACKTFRGAPDTCQRRRRRPNHVPGVASAQNIRAACAECRLRYLRRQWSPPAPVADESRRRSFQALSIPPVAKRV